MRVYGKSLALVSVEGKEDYPFKERGDSKKEIGGFKDLMICADALRCANLEAGSQWHLIFIEWEIIPPWFSGQAKQSRRRASFFL
jgi:hypothetical protein